MSLTSKYHVGHAVFDWLFNMPDSRRFPPRPPMIKIADGEWAAASWLAASLDYAQRRVEALVADRRAWIDVSLDDIDINPRTLGVGNVPAADRSNDGDNGGRGGHGPGGT